MPIWCASAPFFTLENVDQVDQRHIVLNNDIIVRSSWDRGPNTAKDGEWLC